MPFGNIFAQQAVVSTPKPPEISPELRKNAVEFLRQTIKEIPNLKAEENRQYFMSKTACLLWKYDEPQARVMFQGEITNLKKNISQIVTEASPNYIKNVIGENYHRLETQYFFKFWQIKSLRSHLIRNLATVEPDLAFELLNETSKMTPQFEGDLSFRDSFYKLEDQIIFEFIIRDEIDKAINVARGMLKEDFSDELVREIKMIYENDSTKASIFAEETLQTIKSAKLNTNQNYIIRQFLEAAIESKQKGKNPQLLKDDSIIDLAKFLGKQVLAIKKISYGLDDGFEIADLIEKYAPQEAELIRQKFDKKNPANAEEVKYEEELSASVKDQFKKSHNSFKEQLNIAEKREQEIENLFEKLHQDRLNEKEKRQIIERTKRLASEKLSNKERYELTKNIIDLVLISRDKELSAELINVAETLDKELTKSEEDYSSSWQIARGYSFLDLAKSFSILEKTAPKFSRLIESFVNLVKDKDKREDAYANGEIKLAMGFGDGIGDSLFKNLNNSNFVIKNLAENDFSRTVSLANNFDRLEIRLLAKVFILDNLLDERYEIEISNERVFSLP
ncbi:MAG: hypothetical protein K1X72_24010 [Pyrinomonadaceae bacterium]|nr:hypothetical protein [Pyrinomonadaceae bacterium]